MNFLFLITVLLYLATTIFHVLYLTFGERSDAVSIRSRMEMIAFWMTILSFGILTLFIILWWIKQGYFAITKWSDSIAFLAWTITLVYLIIVRLTKLRTLGSFVMPVAFIFILISYSFSETTSHRADIFTTNWVIPHVILIILSYASFIAAFGFGLMYLIAEKKIREKTQTLLYNILPPLDVADELGSIFIFLGVILLTIGVLVGSFLPTYLKDLPWNWYDPKVISTLVTWLIYVVHICIRQFWGWRGRKAAFLSILGFLAVLCTYVGVDLTLDSIHEFQ
ncbi:cytochrome c biogenesis protein CcsA [Candidatus Poribacteria bacterium]|nr:cytochrome c biogenesis protein CcsA [Candidatus Poribacteria bacterium]